MTCKEVNKMAIDKATEVGTQMTLMFYADWARKDVIPNLTKDQKADLCKRLSDLSLEQPIHIAGITVKRSKFPELAPFMHTEDLTGLKCYALYTELFHDLYPE